MERRSLLKNIGLLAGSFSLPEFSFANSKAESPQRVLRIAHLTDIHIQPNLIAANGFKNCLHHLQNLDIRPDLIVNGGDVVMGSKNATLEKSEKEWAMYQKVISNENSLPVYTCVGNHDILVKNETFHGFADGKHRAADKLELSRTYYSFDQNGWHFIVLDSVQEKFDGRGYTAKLGEEQMDWLEKDLRKTAEKIPVMIISHIPILSACVFLDGKNVKNEDWHVPGGWMHTDCADLIALFSKHKNIKLAVSGHIHLQDQVVYNGITYCCNGAVCGNYWFGKTQQTKAGYAVIDLFSDGSFNNNYISYRSRDGKIEG
ncbi:Calcineurin-like phosphoesterase [Dyadobacter koreensis]|uniref:Calcineurin-like phosphoesterase n=1 Tax=Dyadobacter koreensis TaxID=408657 RepID=A0A1H7ANP9_9BACT|nr:metallophosphoesterase [Dyadobacter koreensis]SEJ67243.1 Calcineurin-like phosphoesterase [Dyadobacter koreensis]